MAGQTEKLAKSLEALRSVERQGVIRATTLSRTDRERLVRAGLLQEVIKGWLIASNPASADASSTAWYASYWSFLAQYLSDRFGSEYCLSPEASILRHVASSTIPRQLVVVAGSGSNQVLNLPFGTSVVIYEDPAGLPKERVHDDGIWIMELPAALCRVPIGFFQARPQEAEIALHVVGGATPLLRYLLGAGASAAAGRLAGALEFLGETSESKQIVQAMRSAGHTIRVTNPFYRDAPALPAGHRLRSPHAARVHALWNGMREIVLSLFPKAPGLPSDPLAFLARIDGAYGTDAYNSLSIEGYQVSPELIERVRQGRWAPGLSPTDSREQDALAARGYFQAFQSVKRSISLVLAGENPADVAERDHGTWYQEMFAPAVQSGLLPAAALAGYRGSPVYLRGSRHVPPSAQAVPDCLEAFFTRLRGERSAAVRAVLGHFLFVFIHPYPDGNGRIGRFLMNVQLVSDGYPWTVVRLARRQQYMEALETASVDYEIAPLATFLREEMEA